MYIKTCQEVHITCFMHHDMYGCHVRLTKEV